MKRLLVSLLRAFFPRRCIYCDRVTDPDVHVCRYCEPDVPYMQDPVCVRCGRTKELCTCADHRRHFDRCVAAMRYEDGAVRAILRLKHYDNVDMIETMAYEMTRALRSRCDAAAFDVVTCVPMMRDEQRERGFNQSELLAKEIAKNLGIPFRRTLKKIYPTLSQKSLPMMGRSGNLLGVYDCIENVKDQNIIIIDDLITTGATLHECAKMLKIAQAKHVTALVFAATVPEKVTKRNVEK